MPSAPRSSTSAARVLYIGIVASTLIISLGAVVTSLALGTATSAAGLPDGLALAAGSTAFVIGIQRRKTLNGPTGGRPLDQWWSENTGRVVLVWGLMELTVSAGAVVAFATGHLTAFVALAVMGLAGLGSASPGRLQGG